MEAQTEQAKASGPEEWTSKDFAEGRDGAPREKPAAAT